MNLEARKIEFVQEFLKFQSEEAISRLERILHNEKAKKDDFEISPFVKSISKGTNITTDLDFKKEYSKFLMDKYK